MSERHNLAADCFIRVTSAVVMLAIIGSVVGLIYGAANPLVQLFYMYNIEQVPRMCGTPGDYQPCKVQP